MALGCPRGRQGPPHPFCLQTLASASPPLWQSIKSPLRGFPFLVFLLSVGWGSGMPGDAQGCGLGRFPLPQSNHPALQPVCFGLCSLFPSFFPDFCVAREGEMGWGGWLVNPSLGPVPPRSRQDKETLFSRVLLKSIPPLLGDELSPQVALLLFGGRTGRHVARRANGPCPGLSAKQVELRLPGVGWLGDGGVRGPHEIGQETWVRSSKGTLESQPRERGSWHLLGNLVGKYRPIGLTRDAGLCPETQ